MLVLAKLAINFFQIENISLNRNKTQLPFNISQRIKCNAVAIKCSEYLDSSPGSEYLFCFVGKVIFINLSTVDKTQMLKRFKNSKNETHGKNSMPQKIIGEKFFRKW